MCRLECHKTPARERRRQAPWWEDAETFQPLKHAPPFARALHDACVQVVVFPELTRAAGKPHQKRSVVASGSRFSC